MTSLKMFAHSTVHFNKVSGDCSHIMGLVMAECKEDVVADILSRCLQNKEWSEPQILVIECSGENLERENTIDGPIRVCNPQTLGAYI